MTSALYALLIAIGLDNLYLTKLYNGKAKDETCIACFTNDGRSGDCSDEVVLVYVSF